MSANIGKVWQSPKGSEFISFIIFSPPFEGWVAGSIDYLIVTGLFPGQGG
jgi:hypothetical protein